MKNRGYRNVEFSPQIDGKLCPYVVLEGPLAKRVTGLSLIWNDIKAVREIISRIVPNPEDSISNRGLFFGALALYGKCFTQANGRGVKLEAKQIFHSAEALASHEHLMRLRHELVAHGGNAQEEQLKIVLLLDPNIKKLRGLEGYGATANGLDEQARDDCLDTIELVCSYVEKSLSKANDKLWDAVQEVGSEWAYKHANWPNSLDNSDMTE
ncbi:hypothetical protein [Rheinheimera sp.]|uniref:hypothetical protein n=1 Tax=Rheinheimera sp. TaxID=1869214 RepID=UPI002737791B|nr:hypothetical protein [Rheinheimera sp.]MDP2714030.1 hypothetical protein [Rheinheimera sp.]